MTIDQESQDESQPKIKRGRFDSLNLYEVTEDELNIIERGSPSSIYLNFSVFLVTMAISFLISLLTTKIDSIYTFSIFTILCSVGFFLGIFFAIMWHRNRSESTDVCNKIKSRLKNE